MDTLGYLLPWTKTSTSPPEIRFWAILIVFHNPSTYVSFFETCLSPFFTLMWNICEQGVHGLGVSNAYFLVARTHFQLKNSWREGAHDIETRSVAHVYWGITIRNDPGVLLQLTQKYGVHYFLKCWFGSSLMLLWHPPYSTLNKWCRRKCMGQHTQVENFLPLTTLTDGYVLHSSRLAAQKLSKTFPMRN